MKILRLIAVVTALVLRSLCAPDVAFGAEVIQVEGTTVEYASNPLGIDIARPRLSWKLRSDQRNQVQSAYQVAVASEPARLGTPDVWDSGKVSTNQSALVPYGGPSLSSRTRYFWSVRVWDSQGRPSAWSKPAWWETGLLSERDWRAQWIGHDHPLPLPPAFDSPDIPASLKPGETLGQSFTSVSAFTSLAILIPTFQTKNSSVTLSLYGEGPGGHLIARQRFVNAVDGDWLTLKLRKPAASGKYYLEQSDVDGQVGWWTSRQSNYDFGDAYANGKPVPGFRKTRLDTQGVVSSKDSNPQLRKEFRAHKEIKSARLYASALGLYQVRINGKPVGADVLAPGWTDYNTRVQYQTYDVTELIRRGQNAVAATLAPGWYAGTVGAFGPGQFGLMPGLLLQLEMTYTDGSHEEVVTDSSWKSHTGPVVQADLIMGEQYDARRETPGWDLPNFDDAGWKPVRIKKNVSAKRVAQVDPPVRIEQELKPLSISRTKAGAYIYDLGQNMVGVVRLHVSGKAGQKITIRHAEVLNPDGSLYTANLRSAKSTDVYLLKGKGTETFEPAFTFHGFRYVEVSGAGRQPELVGRVMSTAAPSTLSFSTGVPMLNQLQSNIMWGQRGNFISVPMDTPARDERLGWTGDIAAFSGTATYNMELAKFLGKWLIDLRDTQSPEGEFGAVAPLGPTMAVGKEAPGWGDAGVIVPWALYEQYGDRRLLEDNFDAMTRWVAFLKNNSTGFLRPKSGYGDWLNVADETPKDLIATAFFAHSAAIVAQAAGALGKDPAPYVKLFGQIRDAFDRAFVLPNGRLMGDTQTAYVLALSMDLLPASSRSAAADRLVELIKARDWHLSTGFLGTPQLLFVLSENGHADVAYRLLLQTSSPSWGYQISKGATTMWERWDAVRPDGTFQDPSMNSFNHDAFGSVGKWMYQNIVGIRPGSPGFQKIVIKPRPTEKIPSANGKYDSAYGPIESQWTKKGDDFSLDVSIPVNTSGEIWVPSHKGQKIEADGAQFLRTSEDYAVYKIGSGTYHFSVH
jgi:alpha-L-rhamnosidase